MKRSIRFSRWSVVILLCVLAAQAEVEVSLSGTVTDNNGTALAGVTVSLVNLGLSATTDAQGRYVIDGMVTAARSAMATGLFTRSPFIRQGGVFFQVTDPGQPVRCDVYSVGGRRIGGWSRSSLEPGTYSFDPLLAAVARQVCLVRLRIGSAVWLLRMPLVNRAPARTAELRRLATAPAAGRMARSLAAVDTLVASKPGYTMSHKAVEGFSGTHDFRLTTSGLGLVAPADGVLMTDTRTPTLQWTALNGTVRYEVWVNVTRTDYDWTAPGSLLERYTRIGETAQTSLVTPVLPDRWTYQWYVIAVDASGNRSQSPVRRFGVYIPDLEQWDDGVEIVQGCRDLNKNGTIEPYEDWRRLPQERAADLLSRMTLEEKAFQMFYNAREYPLAGWHMGPLAPDDHPLFQQAASRTRLGIPHIVAGDYIHGFWNMFPTQIGLAASRRYDLAWRCGDMSRQEQVVVGCRGVLGPNAEVGTKALYPRIQEGNGEDADVGAALVRALVTGYQNGPEINPQSVLVTLKHWPGEGAGGEGGIVYDEVTIKYHMKPWHAAIDAGTGSIMPGYAGSDLLDPNGSGAGDSKPILDYLRNVIRFEGVICSDWLPSGIWPKAASAGSDVLGGANPGDIDMASFAGTVGEERINQAVQKILSAKFKLGIFENPYGYPEQRRSVWYKPEFVDLKVDAARQSLTLLENNGILPLRLAQGDTIVVTGPRAKDGSSHCIWTSYWRWQWHGYTIYEGIEQRAQRAGVVVDSILRPGSKPKAIVYAIGERGYTHGTYWLKEDAFVPDSHMVEVRALRKANIPLITVFIMPRPYVIGWFKDSSDAIVAAYRPGDGGGVAVGQLLFGDYEPHAGLPFQLPRSLEQVGRDDPKYEWEEWDLPFDLGATAQERLEIRALIDQDRHVPAVFGDPLYQFGHGIKGFGLQDDTAPQLFALRAPADGTVLTNGQPQLSWQASSDAQTGIRYYEIWLDGKRITTVTDTVYTLRGVSLAAGNHVWYVVAVNWAGLTTQSSALFSFSLSDTQPPFVFDLLAPADGGQVAGASQTLTWQASHDTGSGLHHYEVWIDNAKVAELPGTSAVASMQNLALNRPVQVSSLNSEANPPSAAVDGDPATRWESAFADSQWIVIDLRAVYQLTSVELDWETAYARSYAIELSSDGLVWRLAALVTDGDGGKDVVTSLEGIGRYVRILGVERATGYGISLFEVRVFGQPTVAHTVSGLSTGSHDWFVRAVDGQDNQRQSTSTFSFTVR